MILESDFTFSTESRRRAEDVLIEAKATYHIQLFSGVVHGFATRGDPNVENSRESTSFREQNQNLTYNRLGKRTCRAHCHRMVQQV